MISIAVNIYISYLQNIPTYFDLNLIFQRSTKATYIKEIEQESQDRILTKILYLKRTFPPFYV